MTDPGAARQRLEATVVAVVVVAIGVLGLLWQAAPARAAGGPACRAQGGPSPVVREPSWAQRTLDPARLGSLARGGGQVVAILDSGVDPAHAQLHGRVAAGVDLVSARSAGALDCAGDGTALAGLVVAAEQPGSGLRGLAPEAVVLPVRLTDTPADGDAAHAPSGTVLAKGIVGAVQHGATVVVVARWTTRDVPVLRAAVAWAQARGVAVVAAAGDVHTDGGPTDAPTYPAALPGVLAVGALGPGLVRLPASAVAPFVQVAAPAEAVGTALRSGHRAVSGTGVAATYAGATVALVRQAHPDETAAQAVARVIATADPVAGGQGTPGYGAGAIDPYRAVTDSAPAPAGAVSGSEDIRSVAAPPGPPATAGSGRLPLAVAVGTVVVLFVGGVFLTWARRAARRGWRPERAAVPVARGLPGQGEDGLFEPPTAARPGA